MKITPLFDRVVLKEEKQPQNQTSTSGLVLPETNQEKPLIAKVIAIGDGKTADGEKVSMQVAVGDMVLYSKYSGFVFKLNGEEVVIIRQSDILAKLTQEGDK